MPSAAPRSMAHPATRNDDGTSPGSGVSMFILTSDALRMPRLQHDLDGDLLGAVGAVRMKSRSYLPMKPAVGCQ